MIDVADELMILRRRVEALQSQVDSVDTTDYGSSRTGVAITQTQSSYPAAAGRFYACKLVSVAGTEAEGNTPTYTSYGPYFWAVNIGRSIPPTGTVVDFAQQDGILYFQYD